MNSSHIPQQRTHGTRPGDVSGRAKGSPIHLRSGESCPFAGCALEVDHDGDHVPKLKRIQRYRGTVAGAGIHPGFCEIVEGCREEAVALYEAASGKTFNVCLTHENALVQRGETELLKGWCA